MSICSEEFDPNCDECYEVTRATDDLTFIYGLDATTQYYLWVIDSFNNSYKKLITSGADGSFTIDPTATVYPTGMFNQYAGALEVFISSDVDGLVVIPLTIYATLYNCVILNLLDSTPCVTPTAPGCAPAYITDGGTLHEVGSNETYTCQSSGGNFNMIVNQNGVEIYNEVWDAISTNEINLTLN